MGDDDPFFLPRCHRVLSLDLSNILHLNHVAFITNSPYTVAKIVFFKFFSLATNPTLDNNTCLTSPNDFFSKGYIITRNEDSEASFLPYTICLLIPNFWKITRSLCPIHFASSLGSELGISLIRNYLICMISKGIYFWKMGSSFHYNLDRVRVANELGAGNAKAAKLPPSSRWFNRL